MSFDIGNLFSNSFFPRGFKLLIREMISQPNNNYRIIVYELNFARCHISIMPQLIKHKCKEQKILTVVLITLKNLVVQ